MKKSGYEIEQIVADRFKQAFSETNLIVQLEDQWETTMITKRFDIVIYKGVNPLAVIEVKRSLENKNLLARAIDESRSAISITNSRFGIATDNVTFFIYDRNQKNNDFIKMGFEEIVKNLKDPEKIKTSQEDKKLIVNIIEEAAKKHFKDNHTLIDFIHDKLYLSRIIFNENTNTYHFFDDGGRASIETQLFMKIFGEFKETRICRYTSLRSVFEMLHNISFRMSGLVGMNDRSEVNYVETYLNRGNNQATVGKPLIKQDFRSISALNNRYITCCTGINRRDDLTLYRLYSEDAKGVCLIFDVMGNNDSHFVLQKVKYADINGTHKELDFLKEIINEVERITGFKFHFKKLVYWKHFFKAYDYAVEDEIRLLIIDNPSLDKLKSDWIMTYTHSIFNPVIDFKLNSKSFPIHLKGILLGPKCPEQETNLVQLKEMIRRKNKEIKENNYDSNLRNLKVELSKINHYR